MDETSVIAPSLDWRMSESYYMSIQLSLDGLSFCALDPVTNVYMALGTVPFSEPDRTFAKHEQYILCNDLFARRFRKVLVSVESPAFSMIPNSLYDNERAAALLSLTGIKVRPDDKVLRNNIELANATTLFSVPNFLYFFLKNQFKSVEIYHSTTPTLTAMLLKKRGDSAECMLDVSICSDSMTVVAVRGNEILLCNRFYCKDNNDYVYMLLYLMSQLNFDVKTTPISLSGNVNATDERVKLLMRFSRLVSFAQAPSYFTYGFEQVDNVHRFNTLFLMPLCVS